MSEALLDAATVGGDAVVARVGALAAALRGLGVRAGVGDVLAAHRALAAVDATSRAEVHDALRTVFCSRRDDLAAFDAAFIAVFGAPGATPPELLDPAAQLALPSAPGGRSLA